MAKTQESFIFWLTYFLIFSPTFSFHIWSTFPATLIWWRSHKPCRCKENRTNGNRKEASDVHHTLLAQWIRWLILWERKKERKNVMTEGSPLISKKKKKNDFVWWLFLCLVWRERRSLVSPALSKLTFGFDEILNRKVCCDDWPNNFHGPYLEMHIDSLRSPFGEDMFLISC